MLAEPRTPGALQPLGIDRKRLDDAIHELVTLALKNMKGCLWRRSKTELHMLEPVAGHRMPPGGERDSECTGAKRQEN